ncbi:uncharacterized protein LOC115629691 [Scaptodrosophila lebanonensis]|uniref:Uncharacterized protein LOC115629691 n=1 Tax=Drosophila lebanonensis TaxID=7225 RepID=A0A6J2U4K7_DROLE|nr:uncharacterized protein LOC115629691 [Scaptodrosophila lebanonensis]
MLPLSVSVWERVRGMFCLPDLLVLCCLWECGLSFGYYLKYAFAYDNLWQHWYSLLGGIMAFALALIWTFRKHRKQRYSFDHYYIIFYGLLCQLLSSCFMLSKQLAVSYYFSFIGLGILYIACFSFISLRSSATGVRPARIAFGNAAHACGLCAGFIIFNEFEPQHCGLIGLSVALLLVVGVCLNELLQHLGWHNYKQSPDLVFQLLNEERLVFLPRRAILAQFVDRNDHQLLPSRQWRVLLLGGIVMLLQRCCCIYSPVYLHLMWSATTAYLERAQLYAPFAIYAAGCLLGTLLLLRYTPKLVYMLFGLIFLTLVVALLCIYDDQQSEHCFLFLCFIYTTLGVLSSHALQLLLECTPFLYTELALATSLALQLAVLEGYKYETRVDNQWRALLASSVTALLLTLLAVPLVQWLLPQSASLVDIRNRLLGVRRLPQPDAQSQFWRSNQFLAHDKRSNEFQAIHVAKSRVFQQYPAVSDNEKF